ncbi:MAG: branched-chain amino acid ABC transporter permease [Brevinematales bacterium]|jgi:branched-chain amino acid transport system permease protein
MTKFDALAWALNRGWVKVVLITVLLYVIWSLIYGSVNDFWKFNLLVLGINIILAVSLNLINGFAGQFSLGHAGFMAVGGYSSAIITLYHSGELSALGMPEFMIFSIAVLAGGITSAVFGFIIGLPALRLKGDYLAIATLGFGEIIRLSVLNVDYLGGAAGLKGLPAYTNGNWIFFMAAAAVIVISNLINSSHGRAILAVREDEIAAESMGISSTRYKVAAFVIGAFFAGIAGALFVHNIRLVNSGSFTFMKTVEILVMVVIGGLGSTTGVIIGAVFFTLTNSFLADYPYERMIIFSIIMIILMLLRPEGLMGSREFRRRRCRS